MVVRVLVMVAGLRKGQVTEYILYFTSMLHHHFLPKSASSAPSTPNIQTYTPILRPVVSHLEAL